MSDLNLLMAAFLSGGSIYDPLVFRTERESITSRQGRLHTEHSQYCRSQSQLAKGGNLQRARHFSNPITHRISPGYRISNSGVRMQQFKVKKLRNQKGHKR